MLRPQCVVWLQRNHKKTIVMVTATVAVADEEKGIAFRVRFQSVFVLSSHAVPQS
jgi:hypothetical protein